MAVESMQTKEDSALSNGYKRLGFVSTSSSTVYNGAENLYKKAKSLAPPVIETKILCPVEGLAAPVVTKVSEMSDKLLHYADDQVDYVVHTAVIQAEKSKSAVMDIHVAGVKNFHVATETYLNYVSKAGEFVAGKFQPATKGVQAAKEQLFAAVEKARKSADPDVAVQMGADAWTTFSSYPPIAKLLAKAEPATQLGLKTFYALHDAVVVTPIYKRALESAVATYSYAATTSAFKMGARYLYPFVEPYADNAYNTLSESKVVNRLIEYWKPSAVTA
ncbi:hypothetical protein CEUSTIGMA_g12151.t1 [Chlamydomonas eustigma]|uniref:Uncharacterized protein n=1 Tax=Chlamydomonas eustigma TaxID=1157962 RepID=A0A250XP59_9CHLO|nr:hypothetical protein CEUSTIGMA_g12151.t1 [Chlamydomonas eustigma]|eukprot:GAX84729.1 hypothetical protein CEUSTIGMA_g12151.t1 [Chlamydomonas eustigma]